MSTGLVWYRNDLRIKDHEALNEACKQNERVIAVYCFDPGQFQKTRFGFIKTGKFRSKFLIESITELRENLKGLNISLFIFQQQPETSIPGLIAEYDIDNVYFQKEWTSEELEVEKTLISKIEEVKFHSYYQQFLYHPEDIPFNDFQDIPKVFTEFRKACEKKSDVRSLIESPSPLPKENLLQEKTSIPTLEDLGHSAFEQDSRTAFPFAGGEDQAKKRIEEYFWKNKNLSEYKETRNGLVGESYSSKLSAWLSNGSISPRQVYWEEKV